MEPRTIPPAQASARQTEMGDKFNRVLFAALDAIQNRKIPYALIGGIAASGLGRPRSTHDIDIFVRPEDAEAALESLEKAGFEIEKPDPRWLFKGWKDEMMVDIIFKSQGDIYFDIEMQDRAQLIDYHGRHIPAVAPEDLVIIKAAVHSEVGPHHWHDALAILSHASVDWPYLLKRARRAPRRLLSLLIYAQSNDIWIPNQVIHELFASIFSPSPAKPAHIGQVVESKDQKRTYHKSQPPSRMQPETYLVGHIQEALATDSRTAALDAQISLGEKKILVKGEANTPGVRRAIEEVIHSVAPGFEIDNQLRVTEIQPPQAEELV